ncbi:hypothetical protein AVEN_25530-1 [Araneus ventricosus]|uniref:Uncharacterized protein n=1 Tax=Araneus ventricosus TaxID=182803 RepID=A0A4Y2BLR7_ARAVE|nr:hypothetical protein AVEN_25530-1 [Araneus ventricosus]
MLCLLRCYSRTADSESELAGSFKTNKSSTSARVLITISLLTESRGSLVVRSRSRDWRVAGWEPYSTEDLPCMGPVARQIIRSGQTSSRWCGAKIPTLARPTQKGCKAGRGPVGRPPPACGGRDLLGTIR